MNGEKISLAESKLSEEGVQEGERLAEETSETREARKQAEVRQERVRERRMLVRLVFEPGEVMEEDFNRKNEKGEFEFDERFGEGLEKLGGMEEKEFWGVTREAIREIERPVEVEGIEKVYERVSGSEAALKVMYALTPEAWSEETEAAGEVDEEGQRRLGVKAMEAFLRKYPTAADFRTAENTFAEMARESENFREVFRDGKGLVEGLKLMVGAMYGEQEDYFEAAEALKKKGERIIEKRREYLEMRQGVVMELGEVSETEFIESGRDMTETRGPGRIVTEEEAGATVGEGASRAATEARSGSAEEVVGGEAAEVAAESMAKRGEEVGFDGGEYLREKARRREAEFQQLQEMKAEVERQLVEAQEQDRRRREAEEAKKKTEEAKWRAKAK